MSNAIKGRKLRAWQNDAARMFMGLKPLDVLTILSPRQRGKTSLIHQLLLYAAINHPRSRQIVISPVNSQNAKIYKELKDVIATSPLIMKMSDTTYEILFKNGSIIKFKSAEQRDSLRGDTADYLYIDEAAYVDDDIIAMVTPYLNVPKGKMIMTSTPRFKQGMFYENYTRGVNKIHHYYSINASDYDNSFFISEEQIEQYRMSMPKSAFKSEIMGQFLEDDEGVFAGYAKCIKRDITNKEPYVIGIDWSSTGTDETVLTVFNKYNEMIDIIGYNDVDANELTDTIAEYINANYSTIKTVIVESNSIGSVYEQILKKKLRNKSCLRLFTTTNQSKRDAVDNLANMFLQGEITILDDIILLSQLSLFIATPTKTGITYKGANNSHDDRVLSLMFAATALKEGRKGRYMMTSC